MYVKTHVSYLILINHFNFYINIFLKGSILFPGTFLLKIITKNHLLQHIFVQFVFVFVFKLVEFKLIVIEANEIGLKIGFFFFVMFRITFAVIKLN